MNAPQPVDAPDARAHASADVFERAKAAILPLLAEAGIAVVTASYDGGGDEGTIHEIAAHGADHAPIGIPNIPCEKFELHYNSTVTTATVSLADAIESFADTALEALYGGWENGEGAHGELVINVAAGTATLDHHARYIEYDTTSTEL